jgi:hypothetical protein
MFYDMKKYLFGFIAIVFAMALSAFTVTSKSKNLSSIYFVYTGDSDADLLNQYRWDLYPYDPSNYLCDEAPDVPVVCVIEVSTSYLPAVTDESSLCYYLWDNMIYYTWEFAFASGIQILGVKEEN